MSVTGCSWPSRLTGLRFVAFPCSGQAPSVFPFQRPLRGGSLPSPFRARTKSSASSAAWASDSGSLSRSHTRKSSGTHRRNCSRMTTSVTDMACSFVQRVKWSFNLSIHSRWDFPAFLRSYRKRIWCVSSFISYCRSTAAFSFS